MSSKGTDAARPTAQAQERPGREQTSVQCGAGWRDVATGWSWSAGLGGAPSLAGSSKSNPVSDCELVISPHLIRLSAISFDSHSILGNKWGFQKWGLLLREAEVLSQRHTAEG